MSGYVEDGEVDETRLKKGPNGGQEKKTLEKIIAHYLVPASYELLFGHDMVLYNEMEGTIVLDYDEYNTIRENWITVLSHFGVLDQVSRGESETRGKKQLSRRYFSSVSYITRS